MHFHFHQAATKRILPQESQLDTVHVHSVHEATDPPCADRSPCADGCYLTLYTAVRSRCLGFRFSAVLPVRTLGGWSKYCGHPLSHHHPPPSAIDSSLHSTLAIAQHHRTIVVTPQPANPRGLELSSLHLERLIHPRTCVRPTFHHLTIPLIFPSIPPVPYRSTPTRNLLPPAHLVDGQSNIQACLGVPDKTDEPTTDSDHDAARPAHCSLVGQPLRRRQRFPNGCQHFGFLQYDPEKRTRGRPRSTPAVHAAAK